MTNLSEVSFFAGFIITILTLVILDAVFVNKGKKIISFRRALLGWGAWVALAALFYFILVHFGHFIHGVNTMEELAAIKSKYKQVFEIIPNNLELSLRNYDRNLGVEYISGYLLEESLSVDNLFVILLILTSFKIEKRFYHQVLFWGIVGAVIFRFIFIFSGAFLVREFEWILYVFAAFLIFTGVKMLLSKDEDDDFQTEDHPIFKFFSKAFPFSKSYRGGHFMTKENGRNVFTYLFLVLLIVEFSDILFAVDSIPAIFAITKDPYIIFFSNVFAILGLRSLFFLIMDAVSKFHHFKSGLSLLLIYIGIKMMFPVWFEGMGITNTNSLFIILGILTLSMIASILFPKKDIADA